MSFGFTADMDNAELSPALLAGFLVAHSQMLTWRAPDAAEKAAFQLRSELKRNGDDLIAVSDDFASGAWVLENMWAGFPDPADFAFIGFNGEGDVAAFGYFEDWPVNWAKAPATNGTEKLA